MIKITTITIPFDSACKIAETLGTGQSFKIADVPEEAKIESFKQLPSGDFELVYSIDDGGITYNIDDGVK